MLNITEKTSTRLKLEIHSQQWIWGVLFGMPFVVTGFGITGMNSNLTTLTCHHAQPTRLTCERTIAGLLSTETATLPTQVTGAEAISDHGTGVVLKTSEGQMELTNHHGIVGEKHYRIADQINTFLNNPRTPELKIQQDDRWEGWIEGAAFFLPGLAVILAFLSLPIQIRCELDKVSGQLLLEKRYCLLGAKVTIHNLAEMQQAQITQPVSSTRKPVYRVQITTSEQPITLLPIAGDQQQCQMLVNIINQFLF